MLSASPRPHAELVILRNVIGPLQGMLRAQLVIASEAWEKKQRVKAWEHLHADACVRDFRICVSARQELENYALQKFRMLPHESFLWKLILEDEMTVRSRTTAYICISRGAANVNKTKALLCCSRQVSLHALLNDSFPRVCKGSGSC